MRNNMNRFSLLAIAAMLIAGQAMADKGIVTIKSTIKPSSGNDPGTGKEVLKTELVVPPRGPFAPDPLTLTFDFLTGEKDRNGNPIGFRLVGKARTAMGKKTNWRIDKVRGGLALFVDDKRVDLVSSPSLADPSRFMVTVTSSPFDNKAHPYGTWTIVFSPGGNGGSTDHREPVPPVVLVPYPAPVPIPVPVPPSGG